MLALVVGWRALGPAMATWLACDMQGSDPGFGGEWTGGQAEPRRRASATRSASYHGHVIVVPSSRHRKFSSLFAPMFYHNVSALLDFASETDMLHQLTHYLESALAHTKAELSVRSFFVGLAVLFLGSFLLFQLSPRLLFRNSARVAHARKILQALLAIITPTQSVWPRQYVNLAYRAASVLESPVRLPLETLYEDVVKQRIELRNPKVHLPLLFKGALAPDTDPSVSFVFSLGRRWRSYRLQDRLTRFTIFDASVSGHACVNEERTEPGPPLVCPTE